MRSETLPSRTGESSKRTATGCLVRSKTPRMPSNSAAHRLAKPGRVRATRVDPHLAVPHCHNALPQCPSHRQPAPRQGVRYPWRRTSKPSALGEVAWLEPFPDALLPGAIDVPPGPEARYEQREAISLAFITALQLLPRRQLAVLILRDVLGHHAHEVADILEATVESVNSALERARASLQQRLPSTAQREPPPAPESPAEQVLVEKFVRADGPPTSTH